MHVASLSPESLVTGFPSFLIEMLCGTMQLLRVLLRAALCLECSLHGNIRPTCSRSLVLRVHGLNALSSARMVYVPGFWVWFRHQVLRISILALRSPTE